MACWAPLLPDEHVLGADVSAISLSGDAASQFGTAVALGPDHLVVGAPGAGTVSLYTLDGELVWVSDSVGRMGQQVWWIEDAVWAWGRGDGLYQLGEGEVIPFLETPDATAIELVDGPEVYTREGEGETLAVRDGQTLFTSCIDDLCEVWLDEELLGTSSPGSAVGWVGEEPCWGDARIESDPSPGSIACRDGTTWDGLEGDHLGVALTDTLTAGVFNKWQVPARARIVSLIAQPTLAIEQAAERSRLSLATNETHLAVGVPGYGRSSGEEGQVLLVALQDLP
jgi:hypothetical protein